MYSVHVLQFCTQTTYPRILFYVQQFIYPARSEGVLLPIMSLFSCFHHFYHVSIMLLQILISIITCLWNAVSILFVFQVQLYLNHNWNWISFILSANFIFMENMFFDIKCQETVLFGSIWTSRSQFSTVSRHSDLSWMSTGNIRKEWHLIK